MDYKSTPELNSASDGFAFDSLEKVRNRLIDLSQGNRLINFKANGLPLLENGLETLFRELSNPNADFSLKPISEPNFNELQGYISWLQEQAAELELYGIFRNEEGFLQLDSKQDVEIPYFVKDFIAKISSNQPKKLNDRQLKSALRQGGDSSLTDTSAASFEPETNAAISEPLDAVSLVAKLTQLQAWLAESSKQLSERLEFFYQKYPESTNRIFQSEEDFAESEESESLGDLLQIFVQLQHCKQVFEQSLSHAFTKFEQQRVTAEQTLDASLASLQADLQRLVSQRYSLAESEQQALLQRVQQTYQTISSKLAPEFAALVVAISKNVADQAISALWQLEIKLALALCQTPNLAWGSKDESLPRAVAQVVKLLAELQELRQDQAALQVLTPAEQLEMQEYLRLPLIEQIKLLCGGNLRFQELLLAQSEYEEEEADFEQALSASNSATNEIAEQLKLLGLTADSSLVEKLNASARYAQEHSEEEAGSLTSYSFGASNAYNLLFKLLVINPLAAKAYYKRLENNKVLVPDSLLTLVNPGSFLRYQFYANGVEIAEFTPSLEVDLDKHSRLQRRRSFMIANWGNACERAIENLYSDNLKAIREQGAVVAYVSIGFLEYFDLTHQRRFAPLFLIPVTITADRAQGSYSISYTGEELIENVSLHQKLLRDYQVVIPKLNIAANLQQDLERAAQGFNTLEEAATLEQQLAEINTDENYDFREYLDLVLASLNLQGFNCALHRKAYLAKYFFAKQRMYLDLDPSQWPAMAKLEDNAIINALFNEKTGLSEYKDDQSTEEYDIDQIPDIHQRYPIYSEADSSQHSALIDVLDGKNLVIKGPPGSGKSQTITNIIAASLKQGKKVLFVAEKMAALEVVQRRLSNIGLGDFCLELHDSKQLKSKMIHLLGTRLANFKRYQPDENFEQRVQEYETFKTSLNNYAYEINAQFGETGFTKQEILSSAGYHRNFDLDRGGLTIFDPALFNDPQRRGQFFTRSNYEKVVQELSHFSEVLHKLKVSLVQQERYFSSLANETKPATDQVNLATVESEPALNSETTSSGFSFGNFSEAHDEVSALEQEFARQRQKISPQGEDDSLALSSVDNGVASTEQASAVASTPNRKGVSADELDNLQLRISDHLWYGVRNRKLTSEQAEQVHQVLSNWQHSLLSIKQLLQGILSKSRNAGNGALAPLGTSGNTNLELAQLDLLSLDVFAQQYRRIDLKPLTEFYQSDLLAKLLATYDFKTDTSLAPEVVQSLEAQGFSQALNPDLLQLGEDLERLNLNLEVLQFFNKYQIFNLSFLKSLVQQGEQLTSAEQLESFPFLALETVDNLEYGELEQSSLAEIIYHPLVLKFLEQLCQSLAYLQDKLNLASDKDNLQRLEYFIQDVENYHGKLTVLRQAAAKIVTTINSYTSSVININYHQVNELIELLKALPSEYVEYRDASYNTASLESYFSELKQTFNKLSKEIASFMDDYEMGLLVDYQEFSRMRETIVNRPNFIKRWFDKDYKAAELKFKRFLKGRDVDFETAQRILNRIDVYFNSLNQFNANPAYKKIFGSLFQGVNTDLEKLEVMVNWVASVQNYCRSVFNSEELARILIYGLTTQEFYSLIKTGDTLSSDFIHLAQARDQVNSYLQNPIQAYGEMDRFLSQTLPACQLARKGLVNFKIKAEFVNHLEVVKQLLLHNRHLALQHAGSGANATALTTYLPTYYSTWLTPELISELTSYRLTLGQMFELLSLTKSSNLSQLLGNQFQTLLQVEEAELLPQDTEAVNYSGQLVKFGELLQRETGAIEAESAPELEKKALLLAHRLRTERPQGLVLALNWYLAQQLTNLAQQVRQVQQLQQLQPEQEQLETALSKLAQNSLVGKNLEQVLRSPTKFNQSEYQVLGIHDSEQNLLAMFNSYHNFASYGLLQSEISNLVTYVGQARDYYQEFCQLTELSISDWFGERILSLLDLIQRNQQALDCADGLVQWLDYLQATKTLFNLGIGQLSYYAEQQRKNLVNPLVEIFSQAFFYYLASQVIASSPFLREFSSLDHEQNIRRFNLADANLAIAQRYQTAYLIDNNAVVLPGHDSKRTSELTEMRLLQYMVEHPNLRSSLRDIMFRAGRSIQALKPCFMMSPASVAQYLTPGHLEFDLMVMDEASQVTPEDALGAIARCKQVVIVGDPKQLPPTNFFGLSNKVEDPEQHSITETAKSILDIATAMFPTRTLRWHYRSQHESLIAFSNQQYYENKLVIFPSPYADHPQFGVKYTYVQGSFNYKQGNPIEAKVVAQAVAQHLRAQTGESVGVVAFNKKQADLINRELNRLIAEDAELFALYEANQASDEPLFVKNLENVQGDERDVIMMSFTYGPNKVGSLKVPQRFGPINGEAGGKRLNVLFTRSKKRMEVFSSMHATDVKYNPHVENSGVNDLHLFLQYAETGYLPSKASTQATALAQEKTDYNQILTFLTEGVEQEYKVQQQLGVSSYRLDLAFIPKESTLAELGVKDHSLSQRYLLGIETDGKNYAQARSARDRDGLRSLVLRRLGWKIQRMWTPDWYKYSQGEIISSLKGALAKLVKTKP